MDRNQLRSLLTAGLLALTASFVGVTSPAQAEEVLEPVFIVTTGNQTEGEAMRALAQAGSPESEQAQKIVRHWDENSGGEPLSVETVTGDRAPKVEFIESEIPNEPAARSTPTIRGQERQDGLPTDGQRWSISDPNSWPVRGNKSSDKWYWQNLILVVEGELCGSTCQVTDKLKATVTVDPGTKSSRIQVSTLYFPNSGGFSSRRWNFQAICSASMCGSEARVDSASSLLFTQFLRSDSDRSNARLTIGVALRQSTIRGTVDDAAKTADCLGQSGTDNRCKYIYNG